MARTFPQFKYCEELIKDSVEDEGRKPLLGIAGTSVKELNFLGTANLKLDSNFQNCKIGL